LCFHLAPLFTAVDLASIAHEFDRIEADVMAENGLDTSDYLKFLGEDSGNVALDGNYSVQVLQKALEVFHVRLVRTTLPEGRAALQESTKQLGFIGNLNGIGRCFVFDLAFVCLSFHLHSKRFLDA
jgi:ataxin-3